MEYPNRIDKHITETSSVKIFSNNIPDNWLIREVTERDYGIDLYIELVTMDNKVIGELISIQLKGKQTISWTKENYVTYSAVNISTSNYWRKFPVPVFLCMVDIEKEEVFFCPVKSFIRRNFFSYVEQDKFSYRINKSDRLVKADLKPFLESYFKEKNLNDLESQIITFISHINDYQEFVLMNQGRDQFMGVEMFRVLYLEHFYWNLKFLSNYFDLDWGIKELKEFYKSSQEMFGKDYTIFELQMDEVVTNLGNKIIPFLQFLKTFITETEREFWMTVNLKLFNFMINVKNDGSIPYY